MFITKEEKEIVQNILKKTVPDCKVWAFGSMVHGKNLKNFSDLDLAIIGKKELNIAKINKLKTVFVDSDLPFRVDIIDWFSINDSFKKIIKNSHKVIV